MSIEIVLQQMIIIFILIGIGIFLFQKKMLSEMTSRQISGLIVNVTNPALLICSAFDEGPRVSAGELALALGIYALIYAVLMGASFLIPYLLRVPNQYHYAYRMLTVFGNVGFIGIPLASAVLGSESLIFVSIFNLLFNILIYTFGVSTLQKAAAKQAGADSGAISSGRWQKLINAGTISAAVTVLFYLGDFNVPVIITSTLSYAGRATTLLSMLVLGVSVAQMAPKEIFSHPRLYGFTLLRQILIPIGCILLARPFVHNTLILNTMALMLAVPAANMPLMLSKQLNVETDTISQGIILTTILSLITIPVVSLFL
ncbi:MAG: AEC family transporter [Clostridiales bacterium]|nr:AEC family transporter [Clostridiales bacterium]